jgi:alpha-ribazole phosphatase
VTASFEEEAEVIKSRLPGAFDAVYCSPLRRCERLARRLFPANPVWLRDDLMEINCGEWEMRSWDGLPKESVDTWMADFVNLRIPGGESYVQLHARVNRCWSEIVEAGKRGSSGLPVAVVAHGGVIRSILAALTGTPLIDSFKAFALHYGCIVRVERTAEGAIHEVLSNPSPAEKEQHKPSSFYRNP